MIPTLNEVHAWKDLPDKVKGKWHDWMDSVSFSNTLHIDLFLSPFENININNQCVFNGYQNIKFCQPWSIIWIIPITWVVLHNVSIIYARCYFTDLNVKREKTYLRSTYLWMFSLELTDCACWHYSSFLFKFLPR